MTMLSNRNSERKYSTPPLEWDTSFCPFSMWNLDQIWHPMGVLKSAHHDDSKTPPTCLIWWSFGWDIWGWRKLKFFKNQFRLHLFQCQLSQSICQLIQRSGTYLKSARHEDSKTVIDCWNWWRIYWDIQGYSLEHIYLTNLVHTKKEKGKDYIK